MNQADSEFVQTVLAAQEGHIAEQEARMDAWAQELQKVSE